MEGVSRWLMTKTLPAAIREIAAGEWLFVLVLDAGGSRKRQGYTDE